MLKRVKVGPKLIAGFLLVALLTLGLGLFSASKLKEVDDENTAGWNDSLKAQVELRKMSTAFEQVRVDIRDYVAARDSEARTTVWGKLRSRKEDFDGSLAAFLAIKLSDEEKAICSDVKRSWDDYQKAVEQIIAATKANDAARAQRLLSEHTSTATAEAEAIERLVSAEGRMSKAESERVTQISNSARNAIWTVSVVCLLLATGIGVLLTFAITRPMKEIIAVAQALGLGDVSRDVTHQSGDELGQLADSFRTMIATIRDRSEIARNMAAGNLSVAVHEKSEHDVLGQALKRCFEVLNGLLRDMDRMSKAHDAGDIDVNIDGQKFEGDYRKVAEGINNMVAGHITVKKKAMACVGEFGRGNFEAPLEKFPGKKAFINETIEQVRANLKALIVDANMLVEAALEGRLDTRADASKHQGDFRKIVDGVNQTLNAIVGPLNVAIGSLHKFSQGEAPDIISVDYRGEYLQLKESINAVADAVKRRNEEVTHLLSAATDGNLDARADVTKFSGGNARLIGGINQLLEAIVNPIRDSAAVLDKLAAGDLTAEIQNQYKGEFNRLKQSINTVSIQVRQAMQQIGQSTSALVASAEELNKVSQQMSSSADETAAQANVVSAASDQVSKNVQTVATGADEMGASIKEIAKNTAEATKVAISAVKTAESTNQTIEKLGQSSAEIGQVIKVITSIAQQTNLLALNATIEAARAGEAGKGFAVVANEVKELAKETAKATEDISQKIEAIQSDTKGAVSAIAQISAVINQINDIQNTIASAVEEQSATTNEISRNLAEAAKGAVDITKNIGGVAEAARSTTAGAVDTQKSAQSLERMAAELQELVSQFKYDEQKGGATRTATTSRSKANGKYVPTATEAAHAEAVH